MRVIDPGHKFALASLDGGEEIILTHVKREGAKYPGNVGHYPGTTTQEICRAEISRIQYVDTQRPCDENKIIVEYFRQVIRALEYRAAREHNRKLKPTSVEIENDPICAVCGHIQCVGDCRSFPKESGE